MALVAAVLRRSINRLYACWLPRSWRRRWRRSPGCPSCCARRTRPLSDTGAAQHYLPGDGAVLTFPMLQFSLLGALCVLGTVWLVWRGFGGQQRSDPESDRAPRAQPHCPSVGCCRCTPGRCCPCGARWPAARCCPSACSPADGLAQRGRGFGFADIARAAAARCGTAHHSRRGGRHYQLIGHQFSQGHPARALRPDIRKSPTPTPTATVSAPTAVLPARKYYPQVDAAIRGPPASPATDRGDDRRLRLPGAVSVLRVPGLTSPAPTRWPSSTSGRRPSEVVGALKNPRRVPPALDTLPWRRRSS